MEGPEVPGGAPGVDEPGLVCLEAELTSGYQGVPRNVLRAWTL